MDAVLDKSPSSAIARSSLTSFWATATDCFGSDWLSSQNSSMGCPFTPPAPLVSSRTSPNPRL